MTTSGTTTLTLTARDIIYFALRKINAAPIGQDPSPGEVDPVTIELNLMLKECQIHGPNLWRHTEGSVTLVANTPSYSLTVDNPLRLVEVRYRYPPTSNPAEQRDLPMEMMTREQYKTLPVKLTGGSPPTQWYFDPQESTQTLYVWPVPIVVSGDTIQYTYQRRMQVITNLSQTLDIPEEWLSTVGYALAARLVPTYGIESKTGDTIMSIASDLLLKAKSFDREDVIHMMPVWRGRRR
jgi:hypothetical protein